LVDLSRFYTAPELGSICDEALRRRNTTLRRLRSIVEQNRMSGRRRLQSIEQVLADRIPGYDPGANDWEQRMDRMWDKWGLPPATRQHRLRLGGHTYVLDRAIVDLKIAIEWNGFETHGSRTGFDRDSDRRARLSAAGWFPLDFTSRTSPELICETVHAVVAERSLLTG
jgi:hypothetical protein